MTKITLQFKTLTEAEAYLTAQGFTLAPAGGWINAAGDDAYCFEILSAHEPGDVVTGFRVVINRKA
jgi:hypothetical protein